MSEQRFLSTGNTRFPVRVYFEARAGVRASIGKRAIHIRVPRHLGRAEREEAIAGMLRWAERTIGRRGLAPRSSWRSFRDGESFSVDGKVYTLRLEERERRTATVHAESGVIRVLVPRGLIGADRARAVTLLVSRCLAREWLPDVRAMVDRINERAFGSRVSAVKLKYLRASWGSCGRSGAINLSTRLLLAPRVVREYVCVHELAHLVERGHTRAFWREVERALPGWRDPALWLRRNGDKLWF